MAEAPRMLICDVDGEAQRIPLVSVVRVMLRLPVTPGPGGDSVDLGGTPWLVEDERSRDARMEDHFVFLIDAAGPRVVVVDRVVGLEPGSSDAPIGRGDS